MRRKFLSAGPAASCMALALCGAQSAHAFEGGTSPFPVGSTGEYVAGMPPVPGLFALEQLQYTSSNGLYDNQGNKRPIPFKLGAFSATTRILAAYPTTVLGASLYSQLVIPAVSLHTDIAGHSERHNGVANITVSPVILRWSLAPYTNLIAGLDVALSNGSYNPNRSSVSTGYTSFQPVLGFRHNDPNGLDVGLINRLLINQENDSTNYRSGRGYVAEFTAGWNAGPWKMGVVGSYLNQFSDDQQNGAVIPGNRARSFALGPSLNYNAGPFSVSLSYQRGIYAANMSRNNILGIGLAIPLWIKS
ncbi:SphA family protein [Variovorax ginsengisoli]|uniref:Transporter n=1 Tax=Variovorax ginsengisoli TaxID=363844 RepID=A0ABT9SBI4_9BURK|nr:transporter [Variovorax ginsengisoli]MDP9901126.1 hypothetical protein [Variovorax ginsengisoli]